MHDVTRILSAIGDGDQRAVGDLLPLVYDELRRLAAQKLAHERAGQTLDATALVHEVYVRLVDQTQPQAFANRRHFVAAAAEAMRRILVENYRRKHSLKRGGGRQRVELDEQAAVLGEPCEDVVALSEALAEFAEKEPVKAELVKLRYFAGVTLAEAAEMLDISHNTADRYWAFARAWLFRRMSDQSDRPS